MEEARVTRAIESHPEFQALKDFEKRACKEVAWEVIEIFQKNNLKMRQMKFITEVYIPEIMKEILILSC